MLKLKSGLAAGALSFALALTSIVPAQAITFPQVPVPAASSVEKVQYRYDRRERRAERHWHGHRGYRYQRPGYRYYDGYDRYRSYRASDNTFQPNNGPRKQCLSPYSR